MFCGGQGAGTKEFYTAYKNYDGAARRRRPVLKKRHFAQKNLCFPGFFQLVTAALI